MIGWTSSRVSGAATHRAGKSSSDEPSVWKIRLMFEFCSAKPIWMPKNPNEMFHNPASDCRGFSTVVALSMTKPLPALSWHRLVPVTTAPGRPRVIGRESSSSHARLANRQPNGQHPVRGLAGFDRLDQSVDQ